MLLKRIIRLGIAVAMIGGASSAQNGSSSKHPDQDSPDLYRSFFFFHEDFGKWTDARISAETDSVRRDKILESSAKYLGIVPSEFTALEAVTSKVVGDMRAISDEAHAYVVSLKSKGIPADRKVLAAFEARRLAAVTAGVAQMKNGLSPESWQGLYGYINNQHRQHVNVSSSGAPPLP